MKLLLKNAVYRLIMPVNRILDFRNLTKNKINSDIQFKYQILNFLNLENY